MEMCYDGALTMPSNYVIMHEEEMTYLLGGAVYTTTKTLKNASNGFAAIAAAAATGTVAETVLAFFTFGVTGAFALYTAFLVSEAVGCYNKCQNWMKTYATSRHVHADLTTLLGVPTNMEVYL